MRYALAACAKISHGSQSHLTTHFLSSFKVAAVSSCGTVAKTAGKELRE